MSASLEPPELPASTSPPLDKSGGRVRRMFGEIAGRYDLLNHLLSLGVDVYWRWRMVRLIPPRGDAPLLDVCTGTGDLALAYARAAAGASAVVGSDFTPEMLQVAMRKAARENTRPRSVTPLTFVSADAQALPFADGQFQIVSVAFGLRNVADPRRGLREMIRVCQPGGRVAVLEFSHPRNRWFGAVYRCYFRHVLPRVGQWISGSRQEAYHYLPESVGEFPCGEELAAMLRDCGLTDVQYRPLTCGIATLYWGTRPAR